MSDNKEFDPFSEFDDLDGMSDDDGLGGFDGDDGNDHLSSASGDSDDSGLLSQQDDDSVAAPAPAAASSGSVRTPEAQSNQSKPFLKSPLGMATIGLAVAAVGGVGFIGVKSLGGGDASIGQATQEPVMPTSGPGFEPSPAKSQQSMSSLQQHRTQGGNVPAPAPAQSAALAPLPSATPMPSQSGEVPTQADVFKAILEELKGQRAELRLIKSSIETVTNDVRDLRKRAEANSIAQDEIRKDVAALSERINQGVRLTSANPVQPQVKPGETAKGDGKAPDNAEEPGAEQVVEADNPLAKGRQRVADFLVVDTSASGQMSIIKKPSSGRIFTALKGEVLNVSGQRLTVTEVADNGSLVILGDKYYIDRTLAAKQAKPEVVKPEAVKPVAAKPAAAKRRGVKGDTSAKLSAPADAKGFTLNAIYDSNNSFGVVDNTGSFKSYKIGQAVPELGGERVTGLDENGNLKVGKYVIKSIY